MNFVGFKISRHLHSGFQTFALFRMVYIFFWVIPQLLNFVPTFRNTLYLPSSQVAWAYTTYEEGRESVFRYVST